MIEGDSSSEYKRVDESFRVTNELDRSKFEISYLSYNAKSKQWYKVDKVYIKIPHDKVGEIYANNDIILKSRILESFSYPPLEMMATGGVAVLVRNGGNEEYLEDGHNCIFYKEGDADDGVKQIERIVKSNNLRDTLVKEGRLTAEKRNWNSVKDQILNLY